MKRIGALLVTLCAALSLQAGESWLFIKPLNYYYDEAKLFVMTDLLKQELQVQGSMSVKMVERPEKNPPDIENDINARKEALSLTQTDVGFSGKISQMENTVFLFFFKWNSGGEIVYQERVSVPIGEDAEALVSRLAKCLITNEKFGKTATSSNITAKDSKQSRRKAGNAMLIARAGMLYPYGESFSVLSSTGSFYNSSTGMYETRYEYDEGNTFSGEFGIGYDINFMILEGMMGFDGNRQFYFNIGGEYLFLQGDFCPYAGGEVGVALVNKASIGYYDYNGSSIDENELEKDSDGFFAGLRVGVLLFRNHTVKFMPEIRAINVFNKDWDNGIRASIGMMIGF
jgi:hypothetical protein